MRIKIFTLLLAISIFLSLSAFGHAQDGTALRYERELLDLINQARAAPLEAAASIGRNPEQVLAELPDLYDILTEGLHPLTLNGDLYAVAKAHTMEMLEHNYYSHDSPDGSTFDDRIASSNYVPMVMGESLGFIAFGNFIEPEEAIRLIFEDMLEGELDPLRAERRNILDPELQEVGIGLGSGTFEIGGSVYNVYLSTCDFATSAVTLLELQFLELINQARENPLAVATSLGMDPDQILEDLPELGDILREGIPPLTLNGSLYAAASAHALDMLENGYYSHMSLDGRSVDNRIRETGYLPLVSGETRSFLASLEYMELTEYATVHFERIIRRELSADCTNRNIFDPEMKEMGIRLITATPEMETHDLYNSYYILMLVCDFAAPVMEELPYLAGRVYMDLDEDGLYDLGEGVAGVPITIEGPDRFRYLFTNRAGGFDTSIEQGLYRIVASPDAGPTERWVDMAEENVGIEFTIEAGSDPS